VGERDDSNEILEAGFEVQLTTSGNLLSSGSNTNNDALTPTLVASLESSTHNTNVTSAVKGVVTATIRHLNQVLLNSLTLELGRVDEVGSTELASPSLLTIVNINGNDHTSLVLDSTLHNGQTDAANTEDSHVGTLLDLGGLDGGTVTGGDTTAQQTGAVGGDLGGHSDDGNIGDNGVLGEGGCTHEVEEVLAASLEAGGAIGHDTATLGGANLAAEVGLARLAELALTALGGAILW
jgi:hypothetical protein